MEMQNYIALALRVAKITNLNYYQVLQMSVLECFNLFEYEIEREEKANMKLSQK
jgi:hypothetical protein